MRFALVSSPHLKMGINCSASPVTTWIEPRKPPQPDFPSWEKEILLQELLGTAGHWERVF